MFSADRELAVELECLCTKLCNCKKPPPKELDGSGEFYEVSLECPEHTWSPHPNPNCSVHNVAP